MKLIIIAGMPGAGKQEFITATHDLGIPFLRMGDIVRKFYVERSKEDKDLTIGQLASIDRKRYGFDIWAKRSIDSIYGNIFMIDGCRSMDEVKAYRAVTKDVSIVGIFASPMIRYDRLVKRGREDAPKNIEEFNERDNRELGWGLGTIMALADKIIINESSIKEFRQRVRELMEAYCL